MFRLFTSALCLTFAFCTFAAAAPVALQEATATFHQNNFGNVGQTIDGNAVNGGMGFFNNRRSATVIAYETVSDVEGPGQFTFTITQNQFGGHAPQSFRLSVTDADRSTFADGNPPSGAEAPAGDVTVSGANWVLIEPASVISAGGATTTISGNNIITASGANPATETFTITSFNPLGNVTGIRLEALPGPDGFVGRSAGPPHNSNGNAVITEFAADFNAGLTPSHNRMELNIANATATFDQGGSFTIGSAADGVLHGNNGWGVFGQQNQDQTAVFAFDAPIDADDLVVELAYFSGFNAHKLENVRISVTSDANPTATDAGINWEIVSPDEIETTLAGSVGTLQLDESILFSGSNGVPDLHTLIFNSRFEDITGIRLEAFTATGGTVGFPGSNGNIVLSEFRAFATPHIPEPASVLLLSLAGLATMRRQRST